MIRHFVVINSPEVSGLLPSPVVTLLTPIFSFVPVSGSDPREDINLQSLYPDLVVSSDFSLPIPPFSL